MHIRRTVSTEELPGIADRIFTGGESVSDINSALATTGNTVVLAGDHSTLSDRIEISASDVTLIVQNGATVSFADGAAPTTISGNGGTTYTPLIHSNGFSSVKIENRGTIDANNTNHTNAVPIWMKGNDDGFVTDLGTGELVDYHDGVWVVDCTSFEIPELSSTDTGAALVTLEGCESSTIGTLYGKGGDEVLDFNAICSDIEVGHVIGHDAVDQVVDIAECKNITIQQITELGVSNKLLLFDGTQGGFRFTDRANFDNSNNMTVNGIRGEASQRVITVTDNNDVKNLTIRGMDILCQSNNYHVVRVEGNANGMINGLMLEGKVESLDPADDCVYVGGSSQQENITLELTVINDGDNHGVRVENVDEVTGRIVGDVPGYNAVFCNPTGTGTCDYWDLTVIGNDCGRAFEIAGDGSSTGCTFRGQAHNNGIKPASIGSIAADTRLDMQYSGTLNDSGTNTTEAQYA